MGWIERDWIVEPVESNLGRALHLHRAPIDVRDTRAGRLLNEFIMFVCGMMGGERWNV